MGGGLVVVLVVRIGQAMLASPSLEHLLGRLDRLEFVQAISKKDDASALLKLFGEVDGVELPILSGKNFVGGILQSPKVENTKKLTALFLVEVWRAQMGEKLISIDGSFGVPVLGDFLGEDFACQFGGWR